jgi:hypothetical protein
MARLKDKDEVLTPEQLEYLVSGYNLDGDEPFESESEAAKAYFENKEYIMSLRGPRRDDDPSFYGVTYPHGSRPAAFWKYENHPSEMRFGDQLAYLKENNLLFLGEEADYLAEKKRREEIRALMTLDDETGN